MAEARHAEMVKAVCAALDSPERVAQALIREQLGDDVAFLGEGRRECPWAVLGEDPDPGIYALYLRGRDLVQMVKGRPDEVVCTL